MSKRLTIPSLMLANFVNFIPQLIPSLLLIEIAGSFNIEVGVAGQLFTTQSVVSAIMALLMGILSVRYRHKLLLLAGLTFLGVAALGCAIVPTFSLLLVVFAFTGISFVMVMPTSQALVGSIFPVHERPKILGYLIAGFALSYVIGSPIISLIGDWRLAFSLFMFPLTLGSLFLLFVGIPSVARTVPTSQRYIQGFTEVVRNKSAFTCLVANVLFYIANRVWGFFSIPFYRQQFLVDTVSTSLLVTGSSLIFVVSSLIGGRLVNRLGRKPLTVLCSLLSGFLYIVFINVSNLWLSILLMYAAGVTTSLRGTAYNSLALEQIPGYRGTMMSLSQFAQNVAGALGTTLGGILLITFDYGHLGILSITAIIAAIVIQLFTIDPITQRTALHSDEMTQI